MKSQGIQEQFFKIILERYPSKIELVEELGRVLGCGRDAVYRRIRGETILTPDQLQLLALHYKISLDRLVFGQTNNVLFSFNAFDKTVKEFDDYFNGILTPLSQLLAIPDVKIHYASLEIPIFYYCFFPELISFKLYVWGRAIWDIPFTQKEPFRTDLIPLSSLKKAQDILSIYMQIPSLQMWSLNIYDNTINQITYHLVSGQINDRKDALILYDRLEALCLHMRSMAECGHKRSINSQINRAPLELFHNEMIYTNNTILVLSPFFKGVFSTFGNPNFLFSNDERIVQYTRHWFSGVLDKSNPLSLNSEKSRHWYFDQLLHKVQDARTKATMI